MSVTIDQANLGENAVDASAGSITLTTIATVAVAGLIVLCVTWGDRTVTLSSVSGGGLTWTIDKQGVGASGNNSGVAYVSAPAPAGLASATVLTATYSAATVGRGISGTSLLGTPSSSPVDVTGGPNDFNTTAAWSTPSMTIQAGSILFGCAHCIITNDTSTSTAPSVEAHDFGAGAGTFEQVVGYRIEPAGGAFTVAGTWAANETGTVVGVAYKAAPNGASWPCKPLPVLAGP